MAQSLYETKFRGQRDRQRYAEGAGEAAALSRMASATRDTNVAGFNQSVRDRGKARAREQTLLHHRLRMEQADQRLRYENNIRDWARLALNQKDLGFRQDMATKQFEEGKRRFGVTSGLERDRLTQQGEQFGRRHELDLKRFFREGEQFDKSFTEGQRRFNVDYGAGKRERGGRYAQTYTPESWAEFEKSGDTSALKRREDVERDTVTGHVNRLNEYGYDVGSVRAMNDLDNTPIMRNGRQVYNDKMQRFQMAYDHIRRARPNAPEDKVVAAAAKRAGIEKAKPKEEKPNAGSGVQPPSGAKRGPDGNWYVQKDGKWYRWER